MIILFLNSNGKINLLSIWFFFVKKWLIFIFQSWMFSIYKFINYYFGSQVDSLVGELRDIEGVHWVQEGGPKKTNW